MDHFVLFGLLVVFCLGLSFLFSGMEAGLFALSRLRIRHLMRSGQHRAALLHAYLENTENFLWTILTGNTLATFAAFSLIIVLLHDALPGQPVWFGLLFLVLALLFYTFFDLLPKILFRTFPNRLCLHLVVPFRFVHLALAPLVKIVTWFSTEVLRLTGGKALQGHVFGNRAEFRLAMQESGHILTSEERVMINGVLDLQNLTVRSVTVPMPKVISVNIQTPISEIIGLARDHRLTRFPVWQETPTPRRIAGIVSVNSLIYENPIPMDRLAGEVLKPALYLREDLRLEEALRRLQRSGQRLAIVLGHDQREIGIVSLEDILKAFLGEVSL